MSERRRSRLPLLLAGVAGVVLISVLKVVSGGDGDGGAARSQGEVAQPQGQVAQRTGCVALRLASSSEKAALLSEMATAYEKADRRVGGRCIDVDVVSKSSGATAEALGRGWNETLDGATPDVWTPASSSWLVITRQRAAERDAPSMIPDDVAHVAQSPLVIAMPRPMAEALGWPQKPIGWSDILKLSADPAGWGRFGHPEWGQFRLGKTNPNFSTSGLNATIGTYFAATGLSSDLTEADIAKPKVTDFVRGVESSVVHYGDISLTFLENLQRADDRGAGLTYVSAVAIEEKSVWDYNRGNPKGSPADLGKHAAPRVPLAAVYPKEGTLVSDHPYAVLTAPWVGEEQRAAAADFLAFLQAPEQQTRFQQAAFRDHQGRPGDLAKESIGLLAAEPKTVIDPPAPRVLDRLQRSWAELRKRARVLLVIDVSGSMGQAVPKSGASKLELAKQAAVKALDQFAPDDQVGLWIFSTDRGPGSPYLELVPVGPLGPHKDELKTRIAGLQPEGGTALYATVRAAANQMRSGLDPKRINGVVFLTDGHNEYPADTDLDGLLRTLDAEDEAHLVRVFPIAYGEDADLGVLRRIAEASRAAAYDAADPASIDKVFTEVVSNF
jgi:Ca-activated chloride channel family protein